MEATEAVAVEADAENAGKRLVEINVEGGRALGLPSFHAGNNPLTELFV